MTDASTVRMLRAYIQGAGAPRFLAGFFQSPAENFYESEEVELDIERDSEDVAVVVSDLRSSGHDNESTLYTNKRFLAPVYKESAAITGFDMIRRQLGQNPFESPNYQANAIAQAYRQFRKIQRKIARAIELQASQVLQTAKLLLTNQEGEARYELDFQPKATHFPTAAIPWSEPNANPLRDLDALAERIRRDGQTIPSRLLFGMRAFDAFSRNGEVRERLDNRRISVGEIAPQSRGQGATFQGWIWLGHYRLEMWTYDGFYRDPATGTPREYLDPGRVVMLSDGARLDLTFGALPRISQPDPRALPFLPSRISSGEAGIDLSTNAWLDAPGENLMVSAGSRPLCIPTAIDSFGCLTTGAA